MAKALKIIVVRVVILALGALIFLGASGATVELENSWTPPDYQEEGEVVAGLSALDVFLQAVDNYYNAEYFKHVYSLDFKAGLGSIPLATQQTIEIVKFEKGKIFNQVTKQGSGLGKTNEGSRFYFDGSEGYSISEDSKERFPKLGEEDWEGLQFSVYSSAEKTATEKAISVKKFTSYIIDADNLSPAHNDKVYLLGGKYYFAITINCLGIDAGTIQKVVEDGIMDALGDNAEPGSFAWKEDTVLSLEVSKIGEGYYITASNLNEKYTAKQSNGIVTTGGQVTSGTFSYSASAAIISTEELLNLA